MPYILYTLGAHSAYYLSTSTVNLEGYERARAWRTRIMRISFEGRVKREEGRGRIIIGAVPISCTIGAPTSKV